MEICTLSNCYFFKAYLSQLVPWLTNGTELLQGIKYDDEDSGNTLYPQSLSIMYPRNFSESVYLRYLSEKSNGVKQFNQQFWPWIQVQMEFEWFDGKQMLSIKLRDWSNCVFRKCRPRGVDILIK
jgi:hypothetical protein